MQAAVVERAGQTPVLADFGEPDLQPGELRVTVAAAALSPLARARASGAHYSAEEQYPFVAGVDGVGRLEDGRRVYFLLPRAPFGAIAERSVVADAHCVAVPDEVDDITAAAIANPGMSSWAALTERARIEHGDTVLINGATGASGRLAVRIARHLGAGRVVATGRNTARLAALGADVVIPLEQPGDALDAAFQDQFAAGVDIVLDYLWGPSALGLLTAAAKAGANGVPIRFVQIGSSSGAEIALPGVVLRAKAIEIVGSGFGSITLDRLMARIGAVFGAATGAGLAIDTRVVPLSRVGSAWTAPDDGRRIVFVPDTP